MSDQRAHERYAYCLRVTLIHEGEAHRAITQNISMGGMFVVTPLDLTPGNVIDVQFRIPALNEDTVCRTLIRWRNKEGVGLQLLESLRVKEARALHQMLRGDGFDEEDPTVALRPQSMKRPKVAPPPAVKAPPAPPRIAKPTGRGINGSPSFK